MSTEMPVFELEADGYTHIECQCGTCGHAARLPFWSIRRRAKRIITFMTLDELRPKFACSRCPERPAPQSIQPLRMPGSLRRKVQVTSEGRENSREDHINRVFHLEDVADDRLL